MLNDPIATLKKIKPPFCKWMCIALILFVTLFGMTNHLICAPALQMVKSSIYDTTNQILISSAEFPIVLNEPLVSDAMTLLHRVMEMRAHKVQPVYVNVTTGPTLAQMAMSLAGVNEAEVKDDTTTIGISETHILFATFAGSSTS
jgi:hypothetical protein